MGIWNFYIRTASEYLKYFLHGNWQNVYNIPGTLEYEAECFSIRQVNEIYAY